MMYPNLRGLLCAVVLTLVPFGAVHAVSIHLEFTATDFGLGSISGTAVAPQGTVSGSIFYEAASTTSEIENITGIDLTIDTYSYSDSEIEFNAAGVFQCVATIPNSGSCITPIDDRDFVLEWSLSSMTPKQFSYSVAGTSDYWTSNTFSQFDINEVPVPPAFLLFGSGLLGLAGTAFRKRKANH